MTNGQSDTAERLVAALDKLLAREAVEARAGAGARVRALQARITPLVAALCKLSEESPKDHIVVAIERLVEARMRNQLLMQVSLTRLQQQIDDRKKALERIRVVNPVYGSRTRVARRLNAST